MKILLFLISSAAFGQYIGTTQVAGVPVTSANGGAGTVNGVLKANGSGTTSAAALADIIALWTTCSSGFLKFDGTCVTPGGGGTVTSSGTPLIHQVAVWTTSTDAKGIAVGTTDKPLVGATGADPAFSKLTLTNPATAATLTIADNKTVTVNNTITLAGTDAQTYTFPTTTATIARTDAANTFTGVQTMTSPAITTPAITGLATGSGVASAATASTLAARDANGNLLAVGFLDNVTSTATDGSSTITLTVGSSQTQKSTGSTTLIYQMPVTSTLALNQKFYFNNLSTGAVTVNSSGGNAVIILAGGTSAVVKCILTSGTSAASWSVAYAGMLITSGKLLTGTNTITLSGTDGTVWTGPSTSFSVARIDAAQTFTGTQTFGALVGTTFNGNTFTTGTGVLTIAASKTATFSNTLTFTGTDSSSVAFGTGGTVLYNGGALGTPGSGNGGNLTNLPLTSVTGAGANVLTFLATPSGANFNSMIASGGIPVNCSGTCSKTAAYTTVLGDGGGTIVHASSDNNARTFTIDSNANVAYPLYTVITIVNLVNTVTIAITSDTMTLAGTASTGSRTLAVNGIATLYKIGTTSWLVSGPGVT